MFWTYAAIGSTSLVAVLVICLTYCKVKVNPRPLLMFLRTRTKPALLIRSFRIKIGTLPLEEHGTFTFTERSQSHGLAD
jgi:hypothetical protein